MDSDSLLGFVSTKMAYSTEDIATEALLYVLQTSPGARKGMSAFLGRISDIDGELIYRTQAVGDGLERPDLVGIGSGGREMVLVESKFWAGLTDNQPVSYLSRLPRGCGAVLLFVAPRKRFTTLWPDLLRRCSNAGLDVEESRSVTDALCRAEVSDGRYLALTSWRALLEYLKQECELADDPSAGDDIRQILGLSSKMDSEAFLPLESGELNPSMGTRYLQFLRLIDDVVNDLRSREIVSTDGLRASPAYGAYRRYFRMVGFGFQLSFLPEYWARLRNTPIWLAVKSAPDTGSWTYSEEAGRRLVPLELETPPRLIRKDDELLIPIFLQLGVERHDVTKGMRDQILEVIGLLRGAEEG